MFHSISDQSGLSESKPIIVTGPGCLCPKHRDSGWKSSVWCSFKPSKVASRHIVVKGWSKFWI